MRSKGHAAGTPPRQVDPRPVILFVVILSGFAAVLRAPLQLAPVLASAVLAAVIVRAPIGTVLRRLRGLWAMLLSVTALQALFSGDIAAGLLVGAAVLQRLVILMLGGAMLAGYPGHTLVQAMLQLKLPYRLAYMVSIGLRFLPQFTEIFRDSLTAMQLRGVEFKGMKLKTRFKIYTYLLMPAVSMGVIRAQKISMAMELRGFGAHDKRTSYAPLRMKGRDWAALAGVAAWAGGMGVGVWLT